MHLLLVEDDPRLADLVARLLGGERHLVERAATGAAALELADGPGHRRDRARRRAAGPRPASRSPARCATAARRCRSSCSPRATASRTASPGWIPVRTTTSSSRSRSRSSPRGCGRSAGGGRRRRHDDARRGTDPARRRDPHRHRRRAAGRPQPARVRAARVPAPPSRPGAQPRPAAGPCLAVRRRGHAGDRRHLRLLPAPEARTGRAAAASRRSAAWATGRRHERRDDDRAPRPAGDHARRARPPPRPGGGSSRGAPAARSSSCVVLGVAIYAAAASSLAATGEAQLEARAVELTDVALSAASCPGRATGCSP